MAPLPKTFTTPDGRCGITVSNLELGQDITVTVSAGKVYSTQPVPQFLCDYTFPWAWRQARSFVWVKVDVFDSYMNPIPFYQVITGLKAVFTFWQTYQSSQYDPYTPGLMVYNGYRGLCQHYDYYVSLYNAYPVGYIYGDPNPWYCSDNYNGCVWKPVTWNNYSVVINGRTYYGSSGTWGNSTNKLERYFPRLVIFC